MSVFKEDNDQGIPQGKPQEKSQERPQEVPKERPRERPRKENWIGESESDQANIQKGGEIPPKPIIKPKDK